MAWCLSRQIFAHFIHYEYHLGLSSGQVRKKCLMRDYINHHKKSYKVGIFHFAVNHNLVIWSILHSCKVVHGGAGFQILMFWLRVLATTPLPEHCSGYVIGRRGGVQQEHRPPSLPAHSPRVLSLHQPFLDCQQRCCWWISDSGMCLLWFTTQTRAVQTRPHSPLLWFCGGG